MFKIKSEKGFSLIPILLIVLTLGLIVAASWLVYGRQQDSKRSVAFSTTKTHLMLEDNAEVGDYILKDDVITIFAGSGSGENFAEIKKITLRENNLEVYIDANYCGRTRDFRPLYVSAQLKNVPTTTQANVNINTTCGTKPTN